MADDTPNAATTPPQARKWIRSGLRAIGWLLLGLTALLMAGWATLAICFADHAMGWHRYPFALVFLIVSVTALWRIRPRRLGLATFFVLFAAVLTWFICLPPSNDRDWSVDVSRPSWAEVSSDQVVVHNIRNFDYRSETDFTPAWYDRTFDLKKLRTVDLILSYWGSKAIAHAMVSFNFEDDQYLAISIEARKVKEEPFSATRAFFRECELVYIFADERDVLRLRTNYRHEDVYVYRTKATPEETRRIFLSYVQSASALRQDPAWYNALTTNCATSVVPHARAGVPTAHMGIDILLSGYAARQAYQNGRLDDSIPFEELEDRSHINDVALTLDQDPEFSRKIRAHLPMPPK